MSRVNFHKGQTQTDFPVCDPDLDYEVEVLKFDPFESKTGKAMFKVDMQIVKGPAQEDGSDPVGRRVFDNLYAEDDGKAYMLANALECFNVEADDDGFNDEDFIGATGIVTLGVEDYQGKLHNVVDKYLS